MAVVLEFLAVAGAVLLVLAEAALAFGTAYLLLLTVLAVGVWLARPAVRLLAGLRARATSPDAGPPPQTRFTILVPAHDEEVVLGRTLTSLQALDYPRDRYTIHVIADNCTDRTAAIAREHGVIVHERQDATRRGKGYALHWLFGSLLAEPQSGDAFVIIDADSVVHADFLRALDGHLRRGAVAIQAYDSVLNPDASWGTALRYIAFALLHYLRPLGRLPFGGSAGLKGNGMCFRRAVLERLDWSAFSITEDLQFHLDILLSGDVVTFAPDAVVQAEMPVSMQAARAQNMRWEAGRLYLVRHYVPRLLREALRRRSLVFFDAAMESLVPPFSVMFAGGAVCLGAALLWGEPVAVGLAAFIVGGQIVYTLTGLLLVRAPARVYLALVYAPVYVVWKLVLWLTLTLHKKGRPTEWVRTARTRET